MKNRLKEMLRAREIAIGTELAIPHADVSEVVGLMGFDWIMIDTEHAPLDPWMVQMMLQAMSASSSVQVARVPWNDMVLMKRLLDVGVQGIVAPWVNSKEEATSAVRSMKYPPRGVRGFGPRRAAMLDPDYVKTADDQLFVGVQVETQKAVDNIDEIVSVEGVDAALVGPADLSMSMGIFGQFEAPRFVTALEKVIDSCNAHGVTPGMLGTDDVGKRVKQGFRVLCRGNDQSFIREEAIRSLEAARQAVARAQ